jgi:hypothetical protein
MIWAIALCLPLTECIVAGSIPFAFRWEVAIGSGHPHVVRLGRWTGIVTARNINPNEMERACRRDGLHASIGGSSSLETLPGGRNRPTPVTEC